MLPKKYITFSLLGIVLATYAQKGLPKVAVEFDTGISEIGDKTYEGRPLRRKALHFGLGLRLNPYRRISSMVYVGHDEFRNYSYHAWANYDPSELTRIQFTRFTYQKVLRLQRNIKFYSTQIRIGLGFGSTKTYESQGRGLGVTDYELSLLLTGGIDNEIRMSKRISVKLSWSPVIPVGKRRDSIDHGFHGNRAKSFYKSTEETFHICSHHERG